MTILSLLRLLDFVKAGFFFAFVPSLVAAPHHVMTSFGLLSGRHGPHCYLDCDEVLATLFFT